MVPRNGEVEVVTTIRSGEGREDNHVGVLSFRLRRTPCIPFVVDLLPSSGLQRPRSRPVHSRNFPELTSSSRALQAAFMAALSSVGGLVASTVLVSTLGGLWRVQTSQYALPTNERDLEWCWFPHARLPPRRLFRLFRSSLCEAKGRTCKRGTVQLARTRDTPRAKQSYTENFHRTSHRAHRHFPDLGPSRCRPTAAWAVCV